MFFEWLSIFTIVKDSPLYFQIVVLWGGGEGGMFTLLFVFIFSWNNMQLSVVYLL